MHPKLNEMAAVVVRCYDLLIERRTRGSRILFDAVNEMFSYVGRIAQ